MVEHFFGTLKSECICIEKPITVQKARFLINEFIHFYNHYRLFLWYSSVAGGFGF